MNRSNDFYKQLQQLSYSVYNLEKYPKPSGWTSIEKYENKKTGFYAEAFRSPQGEIFLIPRATEFLDGGTDYSDLHNDWQLYNYQLPDQLSDTFDAYNDLVSKYGNNIKAAGYSLAGTLAALLGNETGIEVVTFEAYGVGEYVPEKHSENIINFGHEKDPIFTKELNYHLGKIYVIPKDDVTELYPSEETKKINPADVYNYHLPNKSGDLDRAIEYKKQTKVLNGYAYYEDFDDNIFDSRNRVFHKDEVVPFWELDDAGQDNYLDQALEPNGLPTKEELEARSRKGELIYVDSYVREDGTKVSGYYRKCPQ